MRIEAILAANLDALMETRPELNSQLKLSRRTNIGQTTVGRMRRAEGAATVDNVDAVAKAFGLTAADLLDPRLLKRLDLARHADARDSAAALCADILDADLSASQVAILANTLAAFKAH